MYINIYTINIFIYIYIYFKSEYYRIKFISDIYRHIYIFQLSIRVHITIYSDTHLLGDSHNIWGISYTHIYIINYKLKLYFF